ncbi:ATP-binding protein [Shinella curvata]|uniref:ATP-binding protein n=1 Tax=Shinella curvata TaxID=1817964 RepID=A0ABT8XMJ5_9HYPH|nr:ATP-binding protein [Shinella curvata]MCJ8057191.1 ATP-binding protein [Shinella curvata]MDO6124962.1 ATP-binding protein [Shinella curvata]
MDWNRQQVAAIARIRATLSPSELEKAEKVKRINDRYLGLTRDTTFSLAFNNLVASVAWHDPQDENRPGKRRILAVCGESGAGKTRTIMEHISLIEAMAPYTDEDGGTVNPVLMYEPPSPCTPKLLAIEGLRKLGMPVRASIRENEAWDTFRVALKAHKIMFVVIDEAQHAVVAANAVDQQKIADAFKGLVQMPDWPVRLILAGVPPLAEFLSEHEQLFTRRTAIRLEKLEGTQGLATIDEILSKIAAHGEVSLNLPTDPNVKFKERLSHAGSGNFGTIVQMIRGAVELAVLEGAPEVSKVHFEKMYMAYSGCLEHENVFTHAAWQELEPLKAFMRVNDKAPRTRRERGEKQIKFGDRP